MARGQYNNELPARIYFLKAKYGSTYYGPYSKKPTNMQKKEGGRIFAFEYNKATQNYEWDQNIK